MVLVVRCFRGGCVVSVLLIWLVWVEVLVLDLVGFAVLFVFWFDDLLFLIGLLFAHVLVLR